VVEFDARLYYSADWLAVDGDTAIIGARDPEDAGKVFITLREGATWVRRAELTASDAAPGDCFGSSVALDGDTVVIGSPLDANDAGQYAGSAYVFVRPLDGWKDMTETAKLTAADAAAGDEFGASVALHGDTVVVGAYEDAHAGGSHAGSAYVFMHSEGGAWVQQAKLTASDAAPVDWFGWSVATDGLTVLVGAPPEDHGGSEWAGAVYVFVRPQDGWMDMTEVAKLTASDAGSGDWFGYSIALDGNTAVIGAPYKDHAAEDSAGAAYIFTGSGSVWAQQTKLVASDAARWDYFASSVGIDGDTALIGSPGDNNAAGAYAGSAYLFARSDDAWIQEMKLTASSAQAFGVFGTSVAVEDRWLLVGAPRDYPNGSVYVFRLQCDLDGDLDRDGDADIDDFTIFADCMWGAEAGYPPDCDRADLDSDEDVDLADFAAFQRLFGIL
jgi:hypothetical protein